MDGDHDRTAVDELLGVFDATDDRRKRVDVALLPLGEGTQVSRTFTATDTDGARFTTTGTTAVDAPLTLEGARLDVTNTAQTDDGVRVGYVPALRRLSEGAVVRDAVSFCWVEDRFVREEVSLPSRRERPREFWYRWYDDDRDGSVTEALAPAVRSVGERLFQVATTRSTRNGEVTVEDAGDAMRVTAPRPAGRSFTCDASVRNGELFLTGLAEQRRHLDGARVGATGTAAGTDTPDQRLQTRYDDVAVAVAPPYPVTAVGARVTVTDERLVAHVPRCAPRERRDGVVPVEWD